MTLTKNKMVRTIGQRTRLKNREVQIMLEALIELWSETLISGERIELENLFVMETRIIDRGEVSGTLNGKAVPRFVRCLTLRTSRRLRQELKSTNGEA